MSLLIEAQILLADPQLLFAPQPGDPDPSNGKGAEWGKAAPVALVILVLLGIILAFLIRSMNRHVKNVPASFDPVDETSTPAAPDTDEDTPISLDKSAN